MTRIVSLAAITAVLPSVDPIDEMEKAFREFSADRVSAPPGGELLFPDNRGELHVKYGAIRGDDVAVVKIATGFYDNPEQGLPPFGGLSLVISARTGAPLAVLLDEGHLTNLRTAAAGAVAAKFLSPRAVIAIGILGSGVQARLQADLLRRVTDCRHVVLWGRNADRSAACAADIRTFGFDVTLAATPGEVAALCNLIVTVTAAHEPLLNARDVRPGTHVTAIGSDGPDKQELDPSVLAAASLLVADSRAQSHTRGEIFRAARSGAIDTATVVELGEVLAGAAQGRLGDDAITVADLTGLAVQDIMIAKAVLARLGTGTPA